MITGTTEKSETAEAELKQQQLELTRQLAEEQARWIAFNAQFDQLEKQFPISRK